MVLPWLTRRTINWLENYLKPDMKIFEWGSGSSTIFFGRRVEKVYSVEHDAKWYGILLNMIWGAELENCQSILCEPVKAEVVDYTFDSYSSKSSSYKKYNFKEYVSIIDEFPDNFFDLILIDGRSRASCIKHAISKVKKDCFILLDNSERNHYKPILEMMKKYKSVSLGDKKWGAIAWQIN